MSCLVMRLEIYVPGHPWCATHGFRPKNQHAHGVVIKNEEIATAVRSFLRCARWQLAFEACRQLRCSWHTPLPYNSHYTMC